MKFKSLEKYALYGTCAGFTELAGYPDNGLPILHTSDWTLMVKLITLSSLCNAVTNNVRCCHNNAVDMGHIMENCSIG